MIRTLGVMLVLFTSLLAYEASEQTQANHREAHGNFTGEVKPVLYVSDVR